MNLGILLAFIPFIFWGLGDFLIQRSTRTIGTAKTLFSIGILSTPILFWFIKDELWSLSSSQHGAMLTLSILVLIYALTLFRAFGVGKLSVVESIVALELPIAVGMAVFWLGEKMGLMEVILFLIICLGVILASVKETKHLKYHKHLVEKGVWLALAAAGLAASVDIYISVSAKVISPLMTIWYTHAVIAVICGIWITFRGSWRSFYKDFKTHPYLILGQAASDNIAWIGFAYAVTYASVSKIMTISEGYIIVAALLGYFIGKEKLKSHQILGASIALPAVIILAFISG